jgi:hypothetical protein
MTKFPTFIKKNSWPEWLMSILVTSYHPVATTTNTKLTGLALKIFPK